jgi:hypothetical protein
MHHAALVRYLDMIGPFDVVLIPGYRFAFMGIGRLGWKWKEIHTIDGGILAGLALS